MKIARRRFLRLASIGIFLTILASPLAAPRLALGSSLTAPLPDKPLCPKSFTGGGLSYDADTQRCLFGGGGCDFHYV